MGRPGGNVRRENCLEAPFLVGKQISDIFLCRVSGNSSKNFDLEKSMGGGQELYGIAFQYHMYGVATGTIQLEATSSSGRASWRSFEQLSSPLCLTRQTERGVKKFYEHNIDGNTMAAKQMWSGTTPEHKVI